MTIDPVKSRIIADEALVADAGRTTKEAIGLLWEVRDIIERLGHWGGAGITEATKLDIKRARALSERIGKFLQS